MKKEVTIMLIVAILLIGLVSYAISTQGPNPERVLVGFQGWFENTTLTNSVWYFSTIINVNATSCFFQYCNITDSQFIHCLLWNCTLTNVQTENCTILG